jgi:hypothetical protein
MSVCIMQTLAGALPREVELVEVVGAGDKVLVIMRAPASAGDPEPTPVAKPARK